MIEWLKIALFAILLSGCGSLHPSQVVPTRLNRNNFNNYNETPVGKYYLFTTPDSVFVMKRTPTGYEVIGGRRKHIVF